VTPTERDDWCHELHRMLADLNDLWCEHAYAGRPSETMHAFGALAASIDALGPAVSLVVDLPLDEVPDAVGHATAGLLPFLDRLTVLHDLIYPPDTAA
jgi:hypothetical protein